jgi:DnaJ-class molecular chaperone
MFGARGGNPFGGTGGGAGMDDMFSEMFGGRARGGQRHRGAPQPPQEKGRNATAWLDITPEEAKQGGSFELTFTQLIPGSHGSIDRIRRTQNIKISPAVKHGKEIRDKGQGHGHPQGAKGDLIVNVRIDPGEGCIWDGGRIVKEVEVSYSTLALGGKVTVTLPSGVKGKITVPPLSQVGDRQRVKDIDIEFILAELDDLDQSQKDALEALKGVGL